MAGRGDLLRAKLLERFGDGARLVGVVGLRFHAVPGADLHEPVRDQRGHAVPGLISLLHIGQGAVQSRQAVTDGGQARPDALFPFSADMPIGTTLFVDTLGQVAAALAHTGLRICGGRTRGAVVGAGPAHTAR